MTSKAEEYWAKALECEARAEQTRDPFIKQQMIDIAEKWRTMAAYEEKRAVGRLNWRALFAELRSAKSADDSR